MGESRPTYSQRLAGKWQIPLFLVSGGLLAAALTTLRKPPPPPPTFAEELAALETAVHGGLHRRAIDRGTALAARPDATEADRAFIALQLARARYAEAERRNQRTPDAGRQITDHYFQASTVEGNLEPVDVERIGRALLWQRQYVPALERLAEAIERGVPGREDLRRERFQLWHKHLAPRDPEVLDELNRFLETVDPRRLDLLYWAVERKLDLLDGLGRMAEADELIERYKAPFTDSDFQHRFEFLEALAQYRLDRFDRAELLLRGLQRRIAGDDDTYAQAGWLLGRAVMEDGGPQRPEEDLSFLEDALIRQPDGAYATAIRHGRAEALAMLERHEDALEAYRAVVSELRTVDSAGPVNRAVVRGSLGVRSEALRQSRNLIPALEYARLAVELVDPDDVESAAIFIQQLAQTQSMFGEQLERNGLEQRARGESSADLTLSEARAMFADAAETYSRLALAATLNERRSAEASWLAAELFARSGQHERAAERYRDFAIERPNDALVPRALLRRGLSCLAMGRPSDAVSAFQECYARFPRSIDGMNSLVPLAESYLALGPEHAELAERTLRIVLEDSEVFTPDAPAFADALFLLGESQNRRGEVERAIETLEEAVARYPTDRRTWRSLYFLADSYRRSGLAIRAQASAGQIVAQLEQVREQAAARFQRAQELYRRVVADAESKLARRMSRLEVMYLRHARLFEPDCLFELHDYKRALHLYEEAAGQFQDTAAGLAAYVQIINCHVFLGEPDEARSALARALVLVETLPAEAFDGAAIRQTRGDWKSYFEWLDGAGLF